MWFKLKFCDDRGEIVLLGTVSPGDAEGIYFDTECLADALRLSPDDKSFLLGYSRPFSTLCYDYPRLAARLPERISERRVMSLDMVPFPMIFSTEDEESIAVAAAFILADTERFDEALSRSINLNDDINYRYDDDRWRENDDFFDPDRAVEVIVYPPGEGDDDVTLLPKARDVLNEIISLILKVFDAMENDSNV